MGSMRKFATVIEHVRASRSKMMEASQVAKGKSAVPPKRPRDAAAAPGSGGGQG